MYSAPENVTAFHNDKPETSVQPPQPRIVSLGDRQPHQEALRSAFVAENSLPLTLAPRLVALAQELSRDFQALEGLKLERTCATYKRKEESALQMRFM
ncbi:hypothetical protein PoB_000008900 [Plakobranchus ocellatus]|uniref:Uncharacterized protein n=1 Tax=Plakobranchus ocellatus TaxID=259542 RepID=A0AAV3XUZ4_9GAST|nr:hypothetical protein PoB_000008900 [Plakobranchus ocellatus]